MSPNLNSCVLTKCVCVWICAHAHTHIMSQTHACSYMRTCTHTCARTVAHTTNCTHVACVPARVCTYTHARKHACTQKHPCVHTYWHRHTCTGRGRDSLCVTALKAASQGGNGKSRSLDFPAILFSPPFRGVKFFSS